MTRGNLIAVMLLSLLFAAPGVAEGRKAGNGAACEERRVEGAAPYGEAAAMWASRHTGDEPPGSPWPGPYEEAVSAGEFDVEDEGRETSFVAAATPSTEGKAEADGCEPSLQAGEAPSVGLEADSSPDRGAMTYLGKWYVTGYDTCIQCCGKCDGVTASGTEATVGRTCAANGLPFGTVLWIDGIGERVVEDRGGMGWQHADVLCADHAACYAITGWYDVYRVG